MKKAEHQVATSYAIGIVRHRLAYTTLCLMNIHIDKSNGER
jgi:hypothetical protein